MNSHKLVFQFGYGVHGVSPLPHYFEEIYGHTEEYVRLAPGVTKTIFGIARIGMELLTTNNENKSNLRNQHLIF